MVFLLAIAECQVVSAGEGVGRRWGRDRNTQNNRRTLLDLRGEHNKPSVVEGRTSGTVQRTPIILILFLGGTILKNNFFRM